MIAARLYSLSVIKGLTYHKIETISFGSLPNSPEINDRQMNICMLLQMADHGKFSPETRKPASEGEFSPK